MVRLAAMVPTIGRASLARTIASAFQAGLQLDDEVVVVGDTHGGPLPLAEEICQLWGPQVRYVPYDGGYHNNGHHQVNHFLTNEFRTDYVVFNDDDDVWLRGAFMVIHRDIAAYYGKILIYRFLVHTGLVVPPLYQTKVSGLEVGLVSGHCIVLPNRPEWFVSWGDGYCADGEFILAVSNRAGYENVVLRPDTIAVGRPVDWSSI